MNKTRVKCFTDECPVSEIDTLKIDGSINTFLDSLGDNLLRVDDIKYTGSHCANGTIWQLSALVIYTIYKDEEK